MQQHIRQMMSPWLETVKLTIQHVRNGGQRMPVVSVHMRESPLNPVQGETVHDPWIFGNVLIVVVVDELVPEGLAKDDPDNSHKENRDDASDEAAVNTRRRLRRRAAFRSLVPSCRISHSKERLESRKVRVESKN